MKEITLNRNGRGKELPDDATIGNLTIGPLSILTLEDDYDEVKVYGHTRIPAGRYELKLRKEGRMHKSYSQRFPEFHRGMLHLQNVPDYTYVYIHCGNKPADTMGCILVGLHKVSESFISNSTDAYRDFAPLITHFLEAGEQVFINIID